MVDDFRDAPDPLTQAGGNALAMQSPDWRQMQTSDESILCSSCQTMTIWVHRPVDGPQRPLHPYYPCFWWPTP